MQLKPLLSGIFLLLIVCFGCKSGSGGYSEINPPFSGVQPTADTATIDPAQDQVLHFKSGISVEVPTNAFVDENGKVVTTPVTVSVTAYNTPATILASGIPMKYTEDGKERDFESAGMFEIRGYSNDKKVEIAKGKSLTVNCPSKARGDYDFFYFEEQGEKKLAIAGFGPAGGDKANEKRKGKWKKLSAASPANQYDTSKTVKNFKLKFAKKDYPELAEFETINWHLATTFHDPTSADNKWVLDKEWSSVEVSQPKYITGDEVYSFPFGTTVDSVSPRYIREDWVDVSKDRKMAEIVMPQSKTITLWSTEHKEPIIIDHLEENFGESRSIGENYFLVSKIDGECLYDYNGKLVANYGESFDHQFLLNKQRVMFGFRPTGSKSTEYSLRITDLKGNIIKECSERVDASNGEFARVGADKFAFTADDGIIVCDFNGTTIAKLEGSFSWLEVATEDILLCQQNNTQMVAWDYKNGTKVVSSTDDFDLNGRVYDNIQYLGIASYVKGTNCMIVNEADGKYDLPSKLWDYKTNKTLKLTFQGELLDIPGFVVEGERTSGFGLRFYDVNKRKDVIRLNEGYSRSERKFFCSAERGRVATTLIGKERLYDMNGNLLRDFSKYDSLSEIIGMDSNYVYTFSHKGNFRCWDMNGQLKLSSVIQDANRSAAFISYGELLLYNYIFKNVKHYDLRGTLLVDDGRRAWQILGQNQYAIGNTRKGQGAILPFVERNDSIIYQLNVRTSDEEFQTYVFLDRATKQKLDGYASFRELKIKEETKRQEAEGSLLRSFQIQKFGIYNADCLLQEEGMIAFKADFKFGVPTEYNDVFVFLVTSLDGNVVVLYPSYSWDKFCLDPSKPNKLIAVLPGNKMAVFSEDDMKKVDWEKVKQTHKFTFDMKVVDGSVESMAVLDKKLSG